MTQFLSEKIKYACVHVWEVSCEVFKTKKAFKFQHTVNVDFLRIEYMVLAKYQHMSILELILLVKQHILILCKNLLGVDVLIIVN
jgi:hypothetical protein